MPGFFEHAAKQVVIDLQKHQTQTTGEVHAEGNRLAERKQRNHEINEAHFEL